MFLWNLFKGFIPTSGLLGWVFVAGSMVLGLSASAHWLREDAFNDCNAQWELKIAKANASVLAGVAEKDRKIKDLETKLLSVADKADQMEKENALLLKVQRDGTPLGDDCKRCRVPNARIWLRPNTAGSLSTN